MSVKIEKLMLVASEERIRRIKEVTDAIKKLRDDHMISAGECNRSSRPLFVAMRSTSWHSE